MTIKIYQLDQKGLRYPDAAVVTRTITTVSKTRDTIAAPLGGYLEITEALSGTTPSVTATMEAQLKS